VPKRDGVYTLGQELQLGLKELAMSEIFIDSPWDGSFGLFSFVPFHGLTKDSWKWHSTNISPTSK
jgi:hypothetical protein